MLAGSITSTRRSSRAGNRAPGRAGRRRRRTSASSLARVDWQFTLALAAYDLLRLPKLMAAPAWTPTPGTGRSEGSGSWRRSFRQGFRATHEVCGAGTVQDAAQTATGPSASDREKRSSTRRPNALFPQPASAFPPRCSRMPSRAATHISAIGISLRSPGRWRRGPASGLPVPPCDASLELQGGAVRGRGRPIVRCRIPAALGRQARRRESRKQGFRDTSTMSAASLSDGRNRQRTEAMDVGLKWAAFDAMTVAVAVEWGAYGKVNECSGLACRGRIGRSGARVCGRRPWEWIKSIHVNAAAEIRVLITGGCDPHPA